MAALKTGFGIAFDSVQLYGLGGGGGGGGGVREETGRWWLLTIYKYFKNKSEKTKQKKRKKDYPTVYPTDNKLRAHSGCFSFEKTDSPDRSVCRRNLPILRITFYSSNSNFFKIARTLFRVIIFQDFAAPSLQNRAFDLQTGQSGRPVLAKRKHT